MQGFFDNFLPVIPLEDDPQHSDEHPFCYDPLCYCHEDNDAAIASIHHAVQNGLLTPQEATDFVAGKMI